MKKEWIPKNDLTGKEYGNGFDSIYDCQKFIDTTLLKIQMFYAMAVGAEQEFFDEEDYKKWLEESNINNDSFSMEIFTRIEYVVSQLMVGLPKNRRNNVIRCYNTKQKRFADGMDF